MGNGSKIDENLPGASIEIIKLLEKKLDVQFQFIRMPWTRCLVEMEGNRVDGVFNASFKAERLKQGRYPLKEGKVDPEQRLTINAYAFYKLKDSPVEWDGEKFLNLSSRIGVVLGYSAGETLKAKGFTLDEATNTKSNFEKLLYKRVSVVIDSPFKADFLMSQEPEKYKEVVKLSVPFEVKPYYVMLSHQFVDKQPQLAEALWGTLAKLRETEEVKKIYEKYNQLERN